MHRRASRALLPSLAAACVFLVASPACAGDPVAERSYRDGRAAAQAKDWDRACKMFQESQNREPAPGTQLNLADCEEHRGKLVTAMAQYQAAARLFQPGDTRADYAAQHAAALEKRLAKLRVRVESHATVECDGALVDTSSLGSFVAMDPGLHTFVVTAKGHAKMRSELRLGEGESREIELTVGPVLAEGASEPTAAPPVPAANGAPFTSATSVTATDPSKAITTEPSRARRTPAYLAFGVGATGLVVGTVTGFVAIGAVSRVKDLCPSHQCPSDSSASEARDAASQARSMAIVSTVGIGVGLGAIATGTYFWLHTRSNVSVVPVVGESTTGAIVQGRF